MLYAPDFRELAAGCTELHGVGFVSSITTIDQLSQRLDQVAAHKIQRFSRN